MYMLYLKRYEKFFKSVRFLYTNKRLDNSSYFLDSKLVHVFGGKGGDGCTSFLQLWCNERAGPDGGDGGSGGHVIFRSSSEACNLNHVGGVIKAPEGQNGSANSCHGKNAQNIIVNVPIGTIIRDLKGQIVCDFYKEQLFFVASRGGRGGKGNTFFANAKNNSPKVCEYGPQGEEFVYKMELRSIADVGLIGCPNAGKSTLLNAITRARSKITPFEYTTLRPYVGCVHYDDYMQLTVADLPGLVEGSHKNRGLGIQFLKHVERCAVLILVIDTSLNDPWNQYNLLLNELTQFSVKLVNRPKIIVANKVDVEGAKSKVTELERRISGSVIPVSAKKKFNIPLLLNQLRKYHEI